MNKGSLFFTILIFLISCKKDKERFNQGNYKLTSEVSYDFEGETYKIDYTQSYIVLSSRKTYFTIKELEIPEDKDTLNNKYSVLNFFDKDSVRGIFEHDSSPKYIKGKLDKSGNSIIGNIRYRIGKENEAGYYVIIETRGTFTFQRID